jgi:hypothetical protein
LLDRLFFSFRPGGGGGGGGGQLAQPAGKYLPFFTSDSDRPAFPVRPVLINCFEFSMHAITHHARSMDKLMMSSDHG